MENRYIPDQIMDTQTGWYSLPVWVINLLLDLETDPSLGNQFDSILYNQNQLIATHKLCNI